MEYTNHHIERIRDSAKQIHLSADERAQMRARMHAYMRAHPPRGFWARMPSVFSAHAILILRPALAMLLIVAIGGSGVAYAAESALPGGLLYAVKTRINEPLAQVLATTPESKASVLLAQAAERLAEAEQLAARGSLTEDARVTIAQGLDARVSQFDTQVAVLATQDAGTEAASARSDLEATLSAHEDVLARLADTSGSQDARPVVAFVREHVARAQTLRERAEADVAERAGGNAAAIAMGRKEAAVQSVARAQADVERTGPARTGIAHDAGTAAAEAGQLLAAGDTELEHGSYTNAYTTYQRAIRTAENARVRVAADELLAPLMPSFGTAATAAISDTARDLSTTTVSTSTAATSTRIDTRDRDHEDRDATTTDSHRD
jgi:hypothetical protein